MERQEYAKITYNKITRTSYMKYLMNSRKKRVNMLNLYKMEIR